MMNDPDSSACGSGARDFPGRRWIDILLRAAHLIAVIAFGAAILHPACVPMPEYAGIAVFVSGGLMAALDGWCKPGHWVEGAGLSLILKLLLVAGMIALPRWQVPIFWGVVAWSAIFSHAPSRFRNKRLPIFRR
jgi:hypothetical protein